MIGIITSKTRNRFAANDRIKLKQEQQQRLREKHAVHAISKPFGGASEEDVINEIEKDGSRVKDAMQERRGRNQEKTRKKQLEFLRDQQAKAEQITRRKGKKDNGRSSRDG